ncbi:hypothetical protein INR49_014445 [Caranx melampygus]|nr:hypothetical protein INR49_014445 [Caranx melampygus]
MVVERQMDEERGVGGMKLSCTLPCFRAHAVPHCGLQGTACPEMSSCSGEEAVAVVDAPEEQMAAAPGQEEAAPEARFNPCPNGWYHHGTRCFMFVRTPMNWYSAEEYCNGLGGHLASVTNPREYSFLQQITDTAWENAAWLGGFYLQGRWMWIDREGFYYTNWYSQSSSSTYPCTFLRTNCKADAESVVSPWRDTGGLNLEDVRGDGALRGDGHVAVDDGEGKISTGGFADRTHTAAGHTDTMVKKKRWAKKTRSLLLLEETTTVRDLSELAEQPLRTSKNAAQKPPKNKLTTSPGSSHSLATECGQQGCMGVAPLPHEIKWRWTSGMPVARMWAPVLSWDALPRQRFPEYQVLGNPPWFT